jgi:hypothetical protein
MSEKRRKIARKRRKHQAKVKLKERLARAATAKRA